MDVKSNVLKAMEQGGNVDIRRVNKANNQSDYQANHSKSQGKYFKTQRDDEPKEEEDREIMRRIDKQRIRDWNKELRGISRNQPDSILQIQTEAELKSKQFTFPLNQRSSRNPPEEGESQRINPRSYLPNSNYQDNSMSMNGNGQSQGALKASSNQMKQGNQNERQLNNSAPPEKVKFDFHLINNKLQSKKRENKINKTIGNLPRDIQSISELKLDVLDEKDVVDPQTVWSEKFTKPISLVNFAQDDLIEAFSIAYVFPKSNAQKHTHNYLYYRDLAPVSRYLVKANNTPYVFENMGNGKKDSNDSKQGQDSNTNEEFPFNANPASELIMNEEPAFNIKQLEYFNIADIVSGIVNNDYLKKFTQKSVQVEELPSKVQMKVKQLIKQSIETQIKTLPSMGISDVPLTISNQVSSTGSASGIKKTQQQKSTQMNSQQNEGLEKEISKDFIKLHQIQQSVSDQQVQIDQPFASIDPNSTGFLINPQKVANNPDDQRIFDELRSLHGQTNTILNTIGEIKSKKEDIKYIKEENEYTAAFKQIKVEMTAALNELLVMIIKTDKNPYPTAKNSDLDAQVNDLLSNLDRIQGKKTSDGHLKSTLLLTFLEEYKWVKQEELLNRMEFDGSGRNYKKSSANTANTGNITFPNFYHSSLAKSNSAAAQQAKLSGKNAQPTGQQSTSQTPNSQANNGNMRSKQQQKNNHNHENDGNYHSKENAYNKPVLARNQSEELNQNILGNKKGMHGKQNTYSQAQFAFVNQGSSMGERNGNNQSNRNLMHKQATPSKSPRTFVQNSPGWNKNSSASTKAAHSVTNSSNSPFRKQYNILEGKRIPGIPRGISSKINQSYTLDLSSRRNSNNSFDFACYDSRIALSHRK